MLRKLNLSQLMYKQCLNKWHLHVVLVSFIFLSYNIQVFPKGTTQRWWVVIKKQQLSMAAIYFRVDSNTKRITWAIFHMAQQELCSQFSIFMRAVPISDSEVWYKKWFDPISQLIFWTKSGGPFELPSE